MEGYGQKDLRRNLWLKRIFGIGLPVVLLLAGAYFYFRTWPQERTVARFVETLEKKDYQAAYRMWCEQPCRYYSFEDFSRDWGSEGQYRDPSQLKFGSADYCGQGVVFETMYPNTKTFGLWVERSNNIIGFAPEERCGGKRIHFDGLFKRLFGRA
jgi:hypothetical protein